MVTAGRHLVCNRPFSYLQEFNVLPSLYQHLYSFVYITYMYGYVFIYVYLLTLAFMAENYLYNKLLTYGVPVMCFPQHQ